VDDGTPLCDAAGAALVADALRVNTTLTELLLNSAHLSADSAVLLLGALVGHPSLRKLSITGNGTAMEDRSAVGAAVAALVIADAPALHACPGLPQQLSPRRWLGAYL
jgi:hypothetical protein